MTKAQWATARKKIEVTNDGGTSWDSSKVLGVVELGHLVITPAVWTEDEVVSPAVYADDVEISPAVYGDPMLMEEATYDEEGVELTAAVYQDILLEPAVIEYGALITPAVIIEAVETSPAVLSTKVAIDILWAGEPIATSFAARQVWPMPCGVHTFSGWEATYAKDFCEMHPDHIYCNPVNSEDVT